MQQSWKFTDKGKQKNWKKKRYQCLCVYDKCGGEEEYKEECLRKTRRREVDPRDCFSWYNVAPSLHTTYNSQLPFVRPSVTCAVGK